MAEETTIKKFRRLYSETHLLLVAFENDPERTQTQYVDKAVENIQEMINMLPMDFPTASRQHPQTKVLLINKTDPEDEPEEIVKIRNGSEKYSLPENVQMLSEDTVLLVLEDWNFLIWNSIVNFSKDPFVVDFYKPLMLAQAGRCIAFFPDKKDWQKWERNMFVLYTNQIGWFAFTDEEDPVILNEALNITMRGLPLSNWSSLKYIKDTAVRLLIKLNRAEEAYPIVREAFVQEDDYADFMDLKNDEKYLQWIVKDDARIAAEKKRAEEAREAFLRMLPGETEKVKDQFNYPDHPLVKEHAAVLNLIKERMFTLKLSDQYRKGRWEAPDHEDDEYYVLTTWSPEKIAAHEKEEGYHLPDHLKAYLMEIGEGGAYYFCWGGFKIHRNNEYNIRIDQPFPITADELHDIGHYWGIKAWIEPDVDDEGWKEEGYFDESADLYDMFGLAPGARNTDGCMAIGSSNSQDELYLIMNGEFEGEVWVDTLQYGSEAGGSFAPASAEKLHFLPFIAESVQAKHQGYTSASDQGLWL